MKTILTYITKPLAQEIILNHMPVLGKTNLKDFAREFSVAYYQS